MPRNFFSTYKDPEKVKLTEYVIFRKVSHSISQNLQGSSKKDLALSATNQVVTVAGGISTGTTVALIAGASTTAFAVAVTGPLAAAILGVGALALAGGITIKGLYSNRDGAHEKLQRHVWSLIDDVSPEEPIWQGGNRRDSNGNDLGPTTEQQAEKNMDEARQAALYLMQEGQAQFNLMGSKLKAAQQAFDNWWANYDRLIVQFIAVPPAQASASQKAMNDWEAAAAAPRTRAPIETRIRNLLIDANKAKSALADASKQGGALFEYMRCVVQTGNYLQCARIVHYSTFVKLNKKSKITVQNHQAQPGPTLTKDTGDMLMDWDMTPAIRETFQQRSDRKTMAETGINALEAFCTTNHIRMS